MWRGRKRKSHREATGRGEQERQATPSPHPTPAHRRTKRFKSNNKNNLEFRYYSKRCLFTLYLQMLLLLLLLFFSLATCRYNGNVRLVVSSYDDRWKTFHNVAKNLGHSDFVCPDWPQKKHFGGLGQSTFQCPASPQLWHTLSWLHGQSIFRWPIKPQLKHRRLLSLPLPLPGLVELALLPKVLLLQSTP